MGHRLCAPLHSAAPIPKSAVHAPCHHGPLAERKHCSIATDRPKSHAADTCALHLFLHTHAPSHAHPHPRVEAITLADIDADLDMDMEQLLMMDANRLNRQPLTAANDPQRPRRGKAAKPGDNGVDAVDGEEAAGGGKGRAKGGQTPAAALYGVPDDPNLADFDLGGDAFGLEFTAFAARPGGGGGGAAGGGGGGDGFLGATEDLFVVPTLGPYGDTQDASLGGYVGSLVAGAPVAAIIGWAIAAG